MMKYKNIYTGIFRSRPNRFIAMVEIDGVMETCHVKNTGRCRELLVPGAQVFLEKSDNPNRKTAYDLIGVKKGQVYINMDSQAPNQVAYEWLKEQGWDIIKPECKYGNSRLDFYMEMKPVKESHGEQKQRKAFMEVKGVTLEEDGIARFPDAPTERGIRHIEELIKAVEEGYEAYILFVIQMKGIVQFEPNDATHPAFGEALRKAKAAGVKILAYDCVTEPGSVRMDEAVKVHLRKDFSLEMIVEPLLNWFQEHARVLPWREEPSPYRVWVSEIMLQQTRVEAVKPYFERFVTALPDIKSLAECEEETLLKLWEGLGYYNRVRNMQIAARTVVEEFDGQLPADYTQLLTLKGIGNYTAGAIASIAYQIPVPAVDGNVLRVISRVTADESDIMKPSVRLVMEQALQKIIPKENPGDFNQALMELGATVCVPNGTPLCEQCPWQEFCRAKEAGSWDKIPVKSKGKPRKIEEKTVFVIRIGDKVVLNKRSSKGLLAGLYEFPNTAGHLTEEEVLQWAKEHGIAPIRIQPLEPAKHIFSHVEWHMVGYAIRVDELEPQDEKLLFVDVKETEEKYPIPAAFLAYTKYMNIRLGNERFQE